MMNALHFGVLFYFLCLVALPSVLDTRPKTEANQPIQFSSGSFIETKVPIGRGNFYNRLDDRLKSIQDL